MNADDLAKILDELGARLGPAGAHVFDLAIRQVYINALTWGVIAAALFVAGRWAIRRAPESDYVERPMVTMLGWALVLVGVILAAMAVPPMLNPEYAAIRDLLGAIPR